MQQGPVALAVQSDHGPEPALLQLVGENPMAVPPGVFLQLQRLYGNRAVGRLIQRSILNSQFSIPNSQFPIPVQRQEEEEEIQARRQSPISNFQFPNLQASGELEGRLASQRGRGQPLPGEVRAFMEPRFGAYFGDVRVHTDAEAAQLSRDLHAQAFTHGRDVYFGAGRYAPETDAGKRLLAHELTHVVQQGGAQVQTHPGSGKGEKESPKPSKRRSHLPKGPEIQRLSWQNTSWEDATEVKASGGGARGVLFVKDQTSDPPVVVKSGQMMSIEVPLAASIHQEVLSGEREPEEWSTIVPGARIVSPDEGKRIKTVLGDKVQGDERAETILKSVDQPGTLVYQYAPGIEFEQALGKPEETKHTKRGFLKKRNLKPGSALDVFLDRGFWKTMGKVSAVDIFTGNHDRLIGTFNLANFLVDLREKRIGVIDNVHLQVMSAFVTSTGGRSSITPDEAIGAWTAHPLTKQFCEGNYDSIFESVSQQMTSLLHTYIRQKDELFFWSKFDKNEAKAAFTAGLATGKKRLIEVLRTNRRGLLANVPEEKREEAQITIGVRLAYLKTGKIPTFKRSRRKQ